MGNGPKLQGICTKGFQGCRQRPGWGGQNQPLCHCPGAAADLHPQQHMCQRLSDRPTCWINQFKLGIWNKPQELSWRGLASTCSACPDLNADLRASLALQLQQTAETGSCLCQAPTKIVADRTALHREWCQLEAFIPIHSSCQCPA